MGFSSGFSKVGFTTKNICQYLKGTFIFQITQPKNKLRLFGQKSLSKILISKLFAQKKICANSLEMSNYLNGTSYLLWSFVISCSYFPLNQNWPYSYSLRNWLRTQILLTFDWPLIADKRLLIFSLIWKKIKDFFYFLLL